MVRTYRYLGREFNDEEKLIEAACQGLIPKKQNQDQYANTTWYNPSYPFFVCTPDMVYYNRTTKKVAQVIEFKSSTKKWYLSPRDKWQVNLMMIVCEVKEVKILYKDKDHSVPVTHTEHIDETIVNRINGELLECYKSKVLPYLAAKTNFRLSEKQTATIIT